MCPDATGGCEKHRQRRRTVTVLAQVGSICKTSFGDVGGRHHQERRESIVFARRIAGVTITVVGREFSSVFDWSLGTAVVLQEETKTRRPATVATIAVRTEAPTCASRGATPLVEGVVATALRHVPGGTSEGHKERVGAQRVGEVAKQSSMAGSSCGT
jgi:hypothetical protein